jgi:hypothetical protein
VRLAWGLTVLMTFEAIGIWRFETALDSMLINFTDFERESNHSYKNTNKISQTVQSW